MKNTRLGFKFSLLDRLIIITFLILLPFTGFTAASCCSHHGGVASCNSTSGFKLCKDGSTSPTCTCPKKAPKPAVKPAPKTTKTAPAQATRSTTYSSKGCCSRHGGIASCNARTGFQQCKDGTDSPSCKCH